MTAFMTVIKASHCRLPSGFRTILLKVAHRLELTSSRREVAVRIVEDAEMRRLNRRWQGKDRTTDVLAFQTTGDVAVSADRARVQARELGHSFRTELLLLAIHGLQHLADRRDGTTGERAAMLAEGERLLNAVTPERRRRPRQALLSSPLKMRIAIALAARQNLDII